MGSTRINIEELKRLYLDEKRTLQEVGDRFGVSRQAVHSRLIQLGVERRPASTSLKRQAELELARQRRESLRELKRSTMVPRPPAIPERYNVLLELKVGESMEMDVTDLLYPGASIYKFGHRNGIRFSLKMTKRFDNSSYIVTRVL